MIQFYSGKKKLFHFWFHTWFIDVSSSGSGILYLNKNMIDKALGDKKEKVFDKNFAIKLFMTKIEAPSYIKKNEWQMKVGKPIKVHMPPPSNPKTIYYLGDLMKNNKDKDDEEEEEEKAKPKGRLKGDEIYVKIP